MNLAKICAAGAFFAGIAATVAGFFYAGSSDAPSFPFVLLLHGSGVAGILVSCAVFFRLFGKISSRLASASRTLEEIAEMAGPGLLCFDGDGALVYANTRAGTLLQSLDGDPAIQRNCEKLVRCLCPALPDGQSVPDNLFFTTKAGDYDLQVRGGICSDGGYAVFLDDVTGINVSYREIKELRQEKNTMAEVLDVAQTGKLVCDARNPDFPVVYANKAFLEIAGRPLAGLKGKSLPDVVAGAIGLDATMVRIAMTKKETVTVEVHAEKRKKSIWYKVTLYPVLDAGGEPELYACFLQDITEEHAQRTQFYQAQKMDALGQLAGGVAHDFNNLLSIIDGYTRMAMNAVEPDGKSWSYLERIKQANRRGANLTKQLLTFGRHRIVSDNVVDLGAVIRDQETLLRPLLDASINLLVSVRSDLYVECAPDGLEQILMNLAINARDAMPQGGSIMIDAHECNPLEVPVSVPEEDKKGRFVCLSVTDTGVGMGREVQAHMFDPFFTTKEQGKGTGLGLSMVYGIVTQAGGHIDVQSSPGSGTAIRLYFPLSDRRPERKAIVGAADNAAGIRFDGYTALVAEDESDLLSVVTGMLEDMGMEVLAAANGNEALLKQDDFEGKIDFLLTDVVMPELNGVKLAEMVHELRPETKILFMSGYPATGKYARIKIPDGADLLAKPVEFEKLAVFLKARLEGVVSEQQQAIEKGMSRWKATGE